VKPAKEHRSPLTATALGEFAALVRLREGLNQAKVAESVGVIRETVSRFETGEIERSYDILGHLIKWMSDEEREFMFKLLSDQDRRKLRPYTRD
jgi:transcriptional regulator with XRE-family HTH domain